MDVANLTKIKNPHTSIYGVKEFVCLSVCPSVTMCASSKNGEMGLFRPDLDSVCRLKSNLYHKNSYPDLHHSQGGMKFATQISPLLNYGGQPLL